MPIKVSEARCMNPEGLENLYNTLRFFHPSVFTIQRRSLGREVCLSLLDDPAVFH